MRPSPGRRPWPSATAGSSRSGNDEDIRKLIGKETEVIDLQGKLVLPGFNDAHLHFANGGLYLLGIDLRPARDEKEFVSILKEYIKKLPKGEWVTGGNWDHENWPSKKHPAQGIDRRHHAPTTRCWSRGSTATWPWPIRWP